jgi:hypothetical protein
MVWRLCSRQVSAVAAAGSSTPIQPMRTTSLAFIVCPTCRRGEPRSSPDRSTVGHYASPGPGVAFGDDLTSNRQEGKAFAPPPLLTHSTHRLKQDQCFIEVSAIADVSDIMDEVSCPIDMGEASGVADSCVCLLPQPMMASAKHKDRSATKAKATNLRILVFHLLLIQPPPGCLPRRVTGSVTNQTQNTTRERC